MAEQEREQEQGARRLVRIAVYVILVASAGTAFLVGDRLWEAARVGELPIWAPLLPAILFTLFVIFYSVDRWLLVRRKRYPAPRALGQVALAVVFLTLLWPSQATEYRQIQSSVPNAGNHAERLLTHRDADIRATACEVLGYRGDPAAYAILSPLATNDANPTVREVCSRAIERLQTARAE